MADEQEETYEEPVKKFPTFGNLEGAKRAFFNKDYTEFVNQLKLQPYQYFRASYNGASDYDDSPSFVAKNFATGLVKELDDFRKYFLVVHRCEQPNTEVRKYKYESLWIVNTPSIQDVYGERYNDFTFSQVSESDPTEFEKFLSDFQPVPDDAETILAEKYVH